jgi:hypothetical protein
MRKNFSPSSSGKIGAEFWVEMKKGGLEIAGKPGSFQY